MRFTYCPHCATRLVLKEIGDEGLIPYCDTCRIPLWDSFSTCVICAVVNELGEVALIRQSYGNTERFVCIAGYMKPGESAEDAAKREIQEEIGLAPTHVEYIRSWPMEKKDLLMLGFVARVQKDEFQLSPEVASAVWFPLEEAPAQIKEGSIAWQLVVTAKEKV